MLNRDKRLLTIFSGPPGVGKSTYAEALKLTLESKGISSIFIDEFQYFWASIMSMNQSDTTLLEWGKPTREGRVPLHVTDKGYYIAFENTTEGVFKAYKESSEQLVTTEGARRIGGYPARLYYQGLIDRIETDEHLKLNTKLAHVEIRVNNQKDHILRVDKRSKVKKTAAPVEVLLDYFAEDSSHATAESDASEFPQFILNHVLYNDRKAENERQAQQFAVDEMKGVILQVAHYFNVRDMS